MSSHQENDYKPLYKSMKRKLKILIYENECFQEELRKAQRALLRVQRDKSFLLDRIMQYQEGPESSSDSEQTDESDIENYTKDTKRRKLGCEQSSSVASTHQSNTKNVNVKKKKSSSSGVGGAVVVTKNVNSGRQGGKQNSALSLSHPSASSASSTSDGQMSREEIERQLAARQPISDFSTTVSLTLPNQLFSDNLMEGFKHYNLSSLQGFDRERLGNVTEQHWRGT